MSQKIGPREIALRAMREAKYRKVPAVRQTNPEASAPVKPKETTMKKPRAAKTAKKTKAPAAKRAKAPVSAKPRGKGKAPAAPKNAQAGSADGSVMPRPGSKNEIMFNMVRAPQGATEAAICKELGWVRCRVTLNRVCKKAGATLTSEGTGAERVYRATMPPAGA